MTALLTTPSGRVLLLTGATGDLIARTAARLGCGSVEIWT